MAYRARLVLLVCALAPVAASAQPSGTAAAPDWKGVRRDVDANTRRPGDEDFAARRQAIRERARVRFVAADRDGDGHLSRDEAAQLRPFLAHHFDRIDTNRDGRLSEQELADARSRMHRMRHENFNRHDKHAPPQ